MHGPITQALLLRYLKYITAKESSQILMKIDIAVEVFLIDKDVSSSSCANEYREAFCTVCIPNKDVNQTATKLMMSLAKCNN